MPQEVPSLQTPPSSIRFPAFRQAESSAGMDPDQASESGFPVQMKADLLVFNQHLRPWFAHFCLCAHLLNPRFLLSQTRDESLGCFLLPNDGRLEIVSLLRHR